MEAVEPRKLQQYRHRLLIRVPPLWELGLKHPSQRERWMVHPLWRLEVEELVLPPLEIGLSPGEAIEKVWAASKVDELLRCFLLPAPKALEEVSSGGAAQRQAERMMTHQVGPQVRMKLARADEPVVEKVG